MVTRPSGDAGAATFVALDAESLAAVQSGLPGTFAKISTATTTQVKSGAGTLQRVVVNTKGTIASTVSIYDATSGTTNPIAVIDSLNLSGTFEFNCAFLVGLRIITTGTVAPDITVVYR